MSDKNRQCVSRLDLKIARKECLIKPVCVGRRFRRIKISFVKPAWCGATLQEEENTV